MDGRGGGEEGERGISHKKGILTFGTPLFGLLKKAFEPFAVNNSRNEFPRSVSGVY